MQPINWHTFFFLLFGLATSVFAVAVLVSRNVVRMAFYLVLSLGATSGLFFLAGADFVAAMQLLIYVGGTLVLLIFGVMLTAQGPFISMKTGGQDWILATIVGGSLLALLLQTAISVDDWRVGPELARVQQEAPPTATPIGMKLLGAPIEKLQPEAKAGVPSGYLLPFEIISIHLLVVLIGAAYLARPKRRAASATEAGLR
ncbi:MAG: NADH-quinone oxidoreductase subunit J [Planctomycetes bacterium]|nr:NADH-quinone oxidoreductase subunit J [Planctomycetota bacterium]